MFLKKLTILYGTGPAIREIPFVSGLNLIVDETPFVSGKETGNNVGKTTVLRLIDFCLGGTAKAIYTDPENRHSEYKLVKDFLVENKIIVQLILKENLLIEESREVIIERNFLARKDKIQRVNGENLGEDDFAESLSNILFPGQYGKKPAFRQIIAHNIRIEDLSITNTLKHLDKYTKDEEYEALYLFLLGCPFDQGQEKQELRAQIDLEERFKNRLESEQTRAAYEASLAILESELAELERRKSVLNLNPNFEALVERLNSFKFQINQISSDIGRLELRKRLVLEAAIDMQSETVSIDFNQLRQIYEQAKANVGNIHKTFEDLCQFHNRMIESKIRYISNDLPGIEVSLKSKHQSLNELLDEEKQLASAVSQSDTFGDLEQLISGLNEKYRMKGEIDSVLKQLSVV